MNGRGISLGYGESLNDASTTLADYSNSLSVCGAGWFWAKPGGVLEDALWAGVMDELHPADKALFHRYPAPGAEAIREVARWRVRNRDRWSDIGHGGILSDRGEPCQSIECRRISLREKKFHCPLAYEKFRGIVRTSSPSSEFFTLLQKGV